MMMMFACWYSLIRFAKFGSLSALFRMPVICGLVKPNCGLKLRKNVPRKLSGSP